MWLGVDIGTSGVKCVILNEAGTLAAQSQAPLTVARPQPRWSEQDPADWWLAVKVAIGELPSRLRRAVRGVGLSGQMHGEFCSMARITSCGRQYCGTTAEARTNVSSWMRSPVSTQATLRCLVLQRQSSLGFVSMSRNSSGRRERSCFPKTTSD